MLTKFLLTNDFPASCFFSPKGAVTFYEKHTSKLKVTTLRGGSTDYSYTNMPIEIIWIPKKLFNIHIEAYQALTKKLDSVNILDLINEKITGKDDFQTQLIKNISQNLSSNLIFKISLQGMITNQNARSTYNISNGEIVYIESSTSTSYRVRTVDNLNVNIRKNHLEIITPKLNKNNAELWEATLEKIIKEYKKFEKENQ